MPGSVVYVINKNDKLIIQYSNYYLVQAFLGLVSRNIFYLASYDYLFFTLIPKISDDVVGKARVIIVQL